MWEQCPMELLKLVASILTPVVIAVYGYSINKSIQRQNAIAQRHSSWLTKWADDFYKAASGFNDSATSFLFLNLKSEWEEIGDGKRPAAALDMEKLSPDPGLSRPLLLELNRGFYEMYKFAGIADENGDDLKTAASDLLTETVNWQQNGAGDVGTFRQKQLAFNKNSHKVHAELLELNKASK